MSTIALGNPRRDAARGAVRGLGAFAFLAVLVAGLPWLLSTFVGWPLPTALPSPSEFGDALADRFIPEAVLVNGLAIACWVLWFQLTVSVLVEAISVLRRRQAPDVPLAGPLQKLAARLVAAVALLLVLAATRESAIERRPLTSAPTAVATMVALDGSVVGAPTAAAATEPDSESPVHVVKPRDTLWGIAEHRLGDPFRWREVFELNKERPQPDGKALRQPELILPGWRLRLPVDAAPAGVVAREVSVTVPGGGPETMTDETSSTLLAGGEVMVDLGPGGATEQAGGR